MASIIAPRIAPLRRCSLDATDPVVSYVLPTRVTRPEKDCDDPFGVDKGHLRVLMNHAMNDGATINMSVSSDNRQYFRSGSHILVGVVVHCRSR